MEFDDHFVMRPTIKFFQQTVDYTENRLGERGKPVALGFAYHSGENPHFLTVPEIRKFNKAAMQAYAKADREKVA